MTRCLLFLLVVGCASSHENDPAQLFVDQYFALRCEFGLRCEQPGRLGDASPLCHPAAPELLAELYPAPEDDPLMVFDPAAAERCLAELEAAIETCVPVHCDARYTGTVEVGGACTYHEQCVDGTYCTTEASAMCGGRCEPRSAIGSACTWWDECASGQCRDGQCWAPGELGAACSDERYCAAGLACDAGSCTPTVEGSACGRAADCPTGMGCNADGRCEPGILGRLSGPFEACTPGTCPSLFACLDGECTPFPVEGEACTESLRCVRGECSDGRCTLVADGGTCDSRDDCASLRCERERCVPRVALGGRCERDRDCIVGSRCVGAVCQVLTACD